LASLDERFSFLEDDHLFGIASLLDPNYGVYWLPPEEVDIWISRLAASISHIETLVPLSQFVNKPTAVKKPFITFHKHNASEDSGSMRSKIKTFMMLMPEPDPDNYVDVLAYWNLQSRAQPLLADLAKKVLSIPAGTDGVERAFSQTNYIFRQHRRNLSDNIILY
jgi:hypothetical protein